MQLTHYIECYLSFSLTMVVSENSPTHFQVVSLDLRTKFEKKTQVPIQEIIHTQISFFINIVI